MDPLSLATFAGTRRMGVAEFYEGKQSIIVQSVKQIYV